MYSLVVKQQVEYQMYIFCVGFFFTLVGFWRTYLTICKEDSKFLSMMYHHVLLLQFLQNELRCCSRSSDQCNLELVPAFPKHIWQRGKWTLHEKALAIVFKNTFSYINWKVAWSSIRKIPSNKSIVLNVFFCIKRINFREWFHIPYTTRYYAK